MHIVPIEEFDLSWHERAIREAGKNRFEADGEVFPSDEDHRADKKRIAEIKRGLAALTPAQRRSSRWPTKGELKKTLERLSKERGYELWFGTYTGRWTQGSLTKYSDDQSIITSTITVNTSDDGTYYCEAHADLLGEFADAISKVAGPQVTFLGDDYSPADFTGLFVPTSPRTTPAPTTKVKTKTKARTKTKAKIKTKTRTRTAGRKKR